MLAFLVISILGTAVSACAASVPKLNQTSATVIVGKKISLKVLNTKEKVSWSSSNKKIATVSSSGVVKGKKAGNVKITAKVSSKVLTCNVKVQNADAEAVELQITGSNGGDFVAGESEAKVSFKLNNTSTAVQAKILDDEGEAVYTKKFSKCKKNKVYTFNWDGEGAEEGTYTATIIAGNKKTNSQEIYFYIESDFNGGDGSEIKPYEVSNITQLESVARHNGKNFIQTADIDFNYESFISLCTYDTPFTGVYDGGGYSIKNILSTSDAKYYGIFRAVGEKGTVKNLTADGCTYKGSEGVGIIAGYNWGVITDCTVRNCFVTSDEYYAGSICGLSNGIIKTCEVFNNVVNGTRYIGGVCGWNEGVIRECNSTMNNITAGYQQAGGVAGLNEGTISYCRTYSDAVSTGKGFAGGITGVNEGTINNCEVNDSENMIPEGWYHGGICGKNDGSSVNNVYYGNLPEIGSD